MAAMQRMRDARQGQKPRPSGMPEGMQQQRNSSEMGRLWYINDQGELSLSIVKLGASDGSHTVVSNRRDTLEGREIILKEASGSKKDEGPDPRMMMRMRL